MFTEIDRDPALDAAYGQRVTFALPEHDHHWIRQHGGMTPVPGAEPSDADVLDDAACALAVERCAAAARPELSELVRYGATRHLMALRAEARERAAVDALDVSDEAVTAVIEAHIHLVSDAEAAEIRAAITGGGRRNRWGDAEGLRVMRDRRLVAAAAPYRRACGADHDLATERGLAARGPDARASEVLFLALLLAQRSAGRHQGLGGRDDALRGALWQITAAVAGA